MRIYINETIAFHVGDLGGGGDIKPYGGGTDGLNRMLGTRDTGHFGSGVYLSTYRDSPELLQKNYNLKYINGAYKQIDDNLYAFDMDKYNLYKVKNKNHADALFNLLKLINEISYLYYINNFVITKSIKDKFLNAKSFANILKLNIPLSFIKSTAEYIKKYDEKYKYQNQVLPSVSTLFMEMNGFNGVDVSGIDIFDSRLHGSVIYDINKYDRKYATTKKETHFNPVSILTDFNEITPDNLKYILRNFSMINLKKLSLKDVALLYKSLNDKIDDFDLNFMLDNNKITKEQYELLKNLMKHDKSKNKINEYNEK